MSYEDFLPQGEKWIGLDRFWVIEVENIVLGTVSSPYYWEHEPSKWLEVGTVFHEAGSWGKGLGEKLGMQIEARIRKVRYYDGHHYDSIRMGVLRERWEENS